jgi:hypothetical protein
MVYCGLGLRYAISRLHIGSITLILEPRTINHLFGTHLHHSSDLTECEICTQ